MYGGVLVYDISAMKESIISLLQIFTPLFRRVAVLTEGKKEKEPEKPKDPVQVRSHP